MRKSTALKTLLRSPLKTMLTFLLIAAASFALFSRVTDYVITTREAANAEGFYHGVAALDNTLPPREYGDISVKLDDKPWPADEKMEEFSSLPGVTLADTRYMTAGLVEDYRRLADYDYSLYRMGQFVLEGNYIGYEAGQGSKEWIDLLLDDVAMLAGDIVLDSGKPLRIKTVTVEEESYDDVMGSGELPRSFFDGLEEGTRCLVLGEYDEASGRDLVMSVLDSGEQAFCVLEGMGEDYLETEEFAYQKKIVEAARQDLYTYDIVYTSDMRSIPYFNESSMVISQGNILTAEDTDACVVNELFLETYHLSIGDRISIQLGDRLLPQASLVGAKALTGKRISNFMDTVELEIIGAYRFAYDVSLRVSEDKWAYTPSTVFVPSILLPVSVPAGHDPVAGEFSVFIENAHDIEVFKGAAEPLAAEMGLGLRFSDGGWLSIKDSFRAGQQASFLTTVLYVLGAVLALLLAIHLYIGRNKKSYAIMRTLGVSGREAGHAVVLPLVALAVFAVPVGGGVGLFNTLETAGKTLTGMTGNAPKGYVLNLKLPVGTVIFCLAFELAVLLFVTLFFMWKMKKIPPLELLQENVRWTIMKEKAAPEPARTVLIELDIAKLCSVDEMEMISQRKYRAFCHVGSYIFRHMRNGIGRTAVSFVLTAVLATGLGVFVLARLSYQDAFDQVEVKGSATGFSSASINELSESGLVDDLYYYGKLNMCVNGTGVSSSMTLTNDFDRCLAEGYTVTYAEEYDSSVFSGSAPVCLLGRALAKDLDICPGDEITMVSDDLYSFMTELYEDEKEFQAALMRAGKVYQVVGILDSKDAYICSGVFAAANSAAELLYGQPFAVGYCEFTLADNGRLGELDALLKEQKKHGAEYAPIASFYVDSTGLKNIQRVRDLMESLFPIAVVAAAFIGVFGSGLVIMQSAREAACLRILGVTKKRVLCMMALEQIFLCFVGIFLVAGGIILYSPNLFMQSAGTLAVCFALYLLGCVCGTVAASLQVTGHRILELLQVKE